NSAQQELVMRPPTDDVPVDSPVRRAEIRVSSRTANIIPFTQQGHVPWHTTPSEPDTVLDLAEDGRSGEVTIGSSARGRIFHWAGGGTNIDEIAPELIGEEYIVASAKIRASVSATFVVEIGNDADPNSVTRFSSVMSTVANEWVDIHMVSYIEDGIADVFRPYVHMRFISSQPGGTTYEFKDVMVERGQTPSPYKPYTNAVIQVNGDAMNTPTRLFVGLPRHNYYNVFGDYTSVPSRPEDHNSRYNPAIIMESDSAIVGGMQLVEDGNGDRLTLGGKNMPHVELHDRTTEHHDSGKLLIWSSITDSGGRNLIALTENKWYD